jgi:ABC-type arginine transport system permease subunit
MMRYALPGIGNNWQVILKATALVSLLGLEDVVKATQLAGKSTGSRSTLLWYVALSIWSLRPSPMVCCFCSNVATPWV